jgi:signal transduction histidine kinase
MAGNYKRRNFFINKQLQGKVMFQVYLLLAVGIVVFSGLLLYFTSDSLTIVYQNNDLQVGKTPLIFFHDLLKVAWILLIPLGLLVMLRVLFQSHRTAGPLHKFEMVLDEMIAGKVGGTVYLREKDYGQNLAKKITDFNQNIAQTLRRLEELNKQLELCHNEQDIAVLQGRIKELSRKIKKILAAYTIEE